MRVLLGVRVASTPGALATVLRAKRLREVREGDVMLVSPAGRQAAAPTRRLSSRPQASSVSLPVA